MTVLATVVVSPSAGAAPIITVAGSTAGCWGTIASCGSYSTSTTHQGITFNQGFFNEAVDFGSLLPWGPFTVGSFTRPDNTNFLGSADFTLRVTFTLPSGVLPGVSNGDKFTAVFTGHGNVGQGATTVDFENTAHLFTFTDGGGSGSFTFALVDPNPLTPNGSVQSVYAQIGDMHYYPDDPGNPIPEPASLLLLGGGLSVAATIHRRRLRRKS